MAQGSAPLEETVGINSSPEGYQDCPVMTGVSPEGRPSRWGRL